jgi:hypothetical protein
MTTPNDMNYFDPILGGNVAPNILDDYDNVSYNLKLYMIPFQYWRNGEKQAPPNETVVIAQTSVTGVQIDDLSMNFVMNERGLGTSVRADFTLIQPSAADLLDQIMAARVTTGHNLYADVPLFLEIVFQGYESSIDDPDTKGAPTTVAGPYVYQLQVNTVEIAIDDVGSRYDISCSVGSTTAHTDEYFKIPKDMSLRGKTILEYVEDLQAKLAQYKEENLHEELEHDIIEFDMSDVEEKLGDMSLAYQAKENAEQINRLLNAEQAGVTSREEFEKLLEDNPTSLDGGITADKSFSGITTINFTEKTSMQQIFTTIFAMSNSFLDKASRKKVFEDPKIDENGLNLNETFTLWYSLESSVKYGDYDARRNRYSKTVTWKPVIYKTADEKNAVSQKEFELDENAVQTRIKEIGVKKAYHYLFTGLNDQILKVDIKYKNAQLLMAPAGGSMGSISTNANPITPDIKTNHDSSGTTQNAEISAALDKNAVDAIANDIEKNGGASLAPLAQRLGKDDAWIASVAADESRRQAVASQIVYLNNRGQDPLGFYNTTPPQGGTQSSNSPSGAIPYKPEPSGFTYAADLLDSLGGSETVIGEVARASSERAAWKALSDAATQDPADTNPRPSIEYGTHVVNQGASTEDGTYKATLFGYMYNNANHADILIDLNLGIRGDPWYLGKPYSAGTPDNNDLPASEMEDESTSEYIVREKSDNYYLFTMQTPRVIDPDVEDEDFNTGYMARVGTSYFISGIYSIVSYTTSFSGGMFSVDMDKSPKLTSLSLAKYTPPAEST